MIWKSYNSLWHRPLSMLRSLLPNPTFSVTAFNAETDIKERRRVL